VGLPPFHGNRRGDASEQAGTSKVGPEIEVASIEVITIDREDPVFRESDAKRVKVRKPLTHAAAVKK
jgi:hypothetical protein